MPPPLLKISTNNNHHQNNNHFTEQNNHRDNSFKCINPDEMDNDELDEVPDSDSGLEVVEEPTLRPSELMRGNNNRSMSIISGEFCGRVLERLRA